ncbi:hypothetical protein PVT67_16550 [Gallaecimonas kandeliae]|uniref:hypothetical protein n=1 Tax=Gallaecimonas kandeliae TaxID=3029055 RepID=UPI00264828EC|nr:hypothetical protein [Gallaecimonas kandeliae]WKE65253.1 hypothetical protein PVT67_16550 [Gallaecimonas kandeliae]
MFIDFDDNDLKRFFLSSPKEIGDFEGGEFIYSISYKNQFSIVLNISTYEREVLLMVSSSIGSELSSSISISEVLSIVACESELIINGEGNVVALSKDLKDTHLELTLRHCDPEANGSH